MSTACASSAARSQLSRASRGPRGVEQTRRAARRRCRCAAARRPAPRVARRHRERGVAQRLAQRGQVAHHHRRARRERLERREPEPLQPRGQDRRPRARVEGGQLGVGDPAAERHARARAGLARAGPRRPARAPPRARARGRPRTPRPARRRPSAARARPRRGGSAAGSSSRASAPSIGRLRAPEAGAHDAHPLRREAPALDRVRAGLLRVGDHPRGAPRQPAGPGGAIPQAGVGAEVAGPQLGGQVVHGEHVRNAAGDGHRRGRGQPRRRRRRRRAAAGRPGRPRRSPPGPGPAPTVHSSPGWRAVSAVEHRGERSGRSRAPGAGPSHRRKRTSVDGNPHGRDRNLRGRDGRPRRSPRRAPPPFPRRRQGHGACSCAAPASRAARRSSR